MYLFDCILLACYRAKEAEFLAQYELLEQMAEQREVSLSVS